ncbi:MULTISPECIES: chloride channel protein [Myroides]|uniref:Chloride channel protein n=1 Tax=Myroides albus TaxID=2562892 RepID=A0A6I3LLL5_9FLAO|nr:MULTISPECIES: chloride channel protein [Myroides]MTG98577.1 chloride channel protein [Myroides albus]MVX36614.1 chloride channel protein [Myroides sp. LoEW2-1]UVD79944.1 chloride channel protein [Myroides albus]
MKLINKRRIKYYLHQSFKYAEGILFFLKSILSERQFMYLSCVIVGASSAIAVIILKYFAHTVLEFATYIDNISHLPYTNSILPIIGILLTVFVIKKFLNGSIEKGTYQIMIAVAKKSGIMPRKQMYSQIITSSLTVGMGGSLGLESPIAITGAAFGSNYAQNYKLNYKDRTLLLACGVAAGISAAFNAPIAGVLFAIEIIIVDLSVTAFIPIMIASATGTIVSNLIIKEDILLSFKNQLVFDTGNTFYYVLLGILSGFFCVYHARMFRKTEKYISKWSNHIYRRALFGACLLACLIFLFPTLFGEGYNSIKILTSDTPQDILNNTLLSGFSSSEWVLLLFVAGAALVKTFAVGLTMGSGGNGGNFAPSLFVGSYLGFALSKLLVMMGMKDIPIQNFTVVGMAAVISGLFHAPLTAIFLIAEITGGYGLMVPLLIVSSISFAISKHMEKYSMDIKSIATSGLVFTSDKDFNILTTINPQNLIKDDIKTLTTAHQTSDIVSVFSSTNQTFIPILDSEEKVIGIIQLDKVRPIIFSTFQTKFTPINDLIEPAVVMSYQDSTKIFMDAFDSNKLSFLIVQKDKKYIGYIAKSDLMDNYRRNLKSYRID